MAHSNDLDFFNRIPVAGLLVNKIGRPNFIYNLKFLSLVGYTDAQMSEIFIKDYTKVFDEEDITSLRQKLKEAEGTKKSVRQELKLTCSDSTKLITVIEAEVSEENDGSYVLCALTDITAIKKAQADYMLEQERLLSVLRNYDDDLFEYDFDTDLFKIFNKNVLIKDSFGDDRWIKFENFSKNLSPRKKIHPEDEQKIRYVVSQRDNYTVQIRMKVVPRNNGCACISHMVCRCRIFPAECIRNRNIADCTGNNTKNRQQYNDGADDAVLHAGADFFLHFILGHDCFITEII